MSRYQFQVGKTYQRSQIRKQLGLDPDAKGGSWYTGYVEHGGADFIFCNIGIAGRTGHDYHNYFDGDDLVWRGKTGSHREQPTIRRMTAPGAEVHIFWREDDRDPFTYAGTGKASEVSRDVPVIVRWRFAKHEALTNNGISYPDEIAPSASGTFVEGSAKTVTVNAYERNAEARRECIRHHGTACKVCDFDFAKAYGELGAGFIHVHHKVPLANIGKAYKLDPIQDLVPVCPNCHAMLHRRNPPLAVEQLRTLIRGRK